MGRKNEIGNSTSLVDQYRKQLGVYFRIFGSISPTSDPIRSYIESCRILTLGVPIGFSIRSDYQIESPG